MTRNEVLHRLMRGIGEDLRDYRVLRAMLDEKFGAALRHRSARLQDLSERVAAHVEMLEARRQERVVLVGKLAGADAGVTATFPLFNGAARAALEAGWASLEALVLDCKRLNARNGQLMMDQHAIMQRVLHGEAQTYAPA